MHQEFDWDDLEALLEAGQVVPVVGKALLTAEVDGKLIPLEQLVVSRLIEHFTERGDIEPDSDFNDGMSLNEFTLHYMGLYPANKRETRKRMIKKLITKIVSEESFEIPDILKKLAEIDQLDLIVSTTPDSLLDQAISQSRNNCNSLAYKLRSAPVDLDRDSRDPSVYHLFGTFDDNQDFAITDEDMVEFLHHLGTNSEAIPRLLERLRDKNLLLIGCDMPDSLIPFLMRTLANQRLFPSKNYKIVDTRISGDPETLLFMQGFSGEVMLSGTANDFVTELHDRWQRNIGPSEKAESTKPVSGRVGQLMADDDRYHVFVSYRRDDAVAVDKIVETLRSRDFKVWYDKENIQGGDDWMSEVEKNIAKCLLFLPILSENSQSDENVAIREWNLAFERRKGIAKTLPFIVPVVIDEGIAPGAELIDPEFWKYDAEVCIGGQVPPEFIENIESKIKQRIKASMS